MQRGGVYPRAVRLVLLLSVLCGCAPRAVNANGDGAPSPDARSDAAIDSPSMPERPREDTDRDGLCDDTERAFGSDPTRVDTDGDGLSDHFEFTAYTSPVRASDPPPDSVLQWSERPESYVERVVTFVYRGNGGAVYPAFLDTPAGVDGLDPSRLGMSIEALSATPPSNVSRIEAGLFASVLGSTRLALRVVGTYAATRTLGCRRAYLVYPGAHAEGVGTIFARRLVVDVHADERAASDAGSVTDAGQGPWAFRVDGLCVPPPGACR